MDKDKFYKNQFKRCCRRKSCITYWDFAKDPLKSFAYGGTLGRTVGIIVHCPICGAELSMCAATNGNDNALDRIVELAAKEWNVGKKTILPFSWRFNYQPNKKGK